MYWKPRQNQSAFFSQGKVREFLNLLEKRREFYTKHWKIQETLDNFYFIFLWFYFPFLKSSMLLSVIFNWTIFKNGTLKKIAKNGKNIGKVRKICQSDDVGTFLLNMDRLDGACFSTLQTRCYIYTHSFYPHSTLYINLISFVLLKNKVKVI